MSTLLTQEALLLHTNIKCAICLTSLPILDISNKEQQRYFKTCCAVLKINPQFKPREGKYRNLIRFCCNCTLTLNAVETLMQNLASIQTSIRKIGIDIKSRILKCDRQGATEPRSSGKSRTDERFIFHQRERFRHLAVKDFLPVISLDNPDVVPPRRNSRSNINIDSKENSSRVQNITRQFEIEDDPEVDVKHEVHVDADDTEATDFGCDDFLIRDELDNCSKSDTEVQHQKCDSKIIHGRTRDQKKNSTSIGPPTAVHGGDSIESVEFGSVNTLSEDSDFELDNDIIDSDDSDYKPQIKNQSTFKRNSEANGNPEQSKKGKSLDPYITSKGKTRVLPLGYKDKTSKNYLGGAEIKISDGRWSYRTVEYHYDEISRLFGCSRCSKTRNNQYLMRKHIAREHGVEGYGKWSYFGVSYSCVKETGRFKCSMCDNDFSNRGGIGRHIRDKHKEYCVQLKKQSYYEDKAKIKRKEAARFIHKPPVILEDGKWSYKDAQFTKNTSDATFQCDACGRIRKSWHSILLHIQECHNEKGKSENTCKECGIQFGTPYRLKRHLDAHTENKTFQCDQCGEVFKHKGSLGPHKARVHQKKRPYVCEFCAKGFFTAKDCRMHLRTHTKEKPYHCEFPGCGMSFSMRATLKNHMNSNVHQQKDISPV